MRPSAAPRLSERGSMIAPLAHDALDALVPGGLAPSLAVGGVSFVRKAEHHLTVLNYGIGKLIGKAAVLVPELKERIDAAAAAHDWEVRPRDAFVRLCDRKPDRPALETIIVLVDADLPGFYARLRAQIAQLAPHADEAAVAPLLDALGAPPPPHVTLYTTDASGGAGIGLNRVAELEEALAAGAAAPPGTDAAGLRAWPLPSETMRLTS